MSVSLLDFVCFSLAFIRLATFLAVAPVFNTRNAPILIKLGLAALCALAVMPGISSGFDLENLGVLSFLALQEVAIGIVLGFVVVLVFAAVTFAGHYIDTPIGFGMASVFDPALGGQVPVFSQFYYILAALIFLSLDAHIYLLQAVRHSFSVIPFGEVASLEPSFWLISDLIGQIFVIGIQIALPIGAAILLADIGLGIVIRAVPQINVFVLGFPIKIVVGLIVVAFALPAFVYITGQMFAADGLLFRYFHALLGLGGT